MAPSSVLRTWLQRWLDVPPPEDRPRLGMSFLERRIDELEQRCDFLTGALRKLRGRVTGGLRADPARDGEDGVPVSDAPPVRYSNAWMTEDEHRRLARARTEAMGRDFKGDRS